MFKKVKSSIVVFIVFVLSGLLVFFPKFWGQTQPGGCVILAHCGDWIEFTGSRPGPESMFTGITVRNVAKAASKKVQVRTNWLNQPIYETKTTDGSSKITITVTSVHLKNQTQSITTTLAKDGQYTNWESDFGRIPSGIVRIRLHESGFGGSCRSNCTGSWDSDAQVIIPSDAYSINSCCVHSCSGTCSFCGADLYRR